VHNSDRRKLNSADPVERCPRRDLINEILDLSKIEAGKLELNPEPVNLARLIDEVIIGTAGQLAEKNKNRLIVEAQENLGRLTADPMRLKQILLNLLSNACKFTKEGEVVLRARKVADGREWVERLRMRRIQVRRNGWCAMTRASSWRNFSIHSLFKLIALDAAPSEASRESPT
jgi:K+-sensing histidine kinase KdpD